MLTSLTQMPHNVETRWFSPENWLGEKGQAGKKHNGRKGSACFPLASGERKTLAAYDGGSGCVRRIWMTTSNRTPQTLRGLRIQFFWDGSTTPAIDAPLGDFFGQGLGRMSTFESALQSNPEGRSFNCCIPMPFKTAMRIELINESPIEIGLVFYDVNITINDPHDNNTLYLHALWRREQQTSFQKDYEFIPRIHGRGRFLGVNVGVIANTEVYQRTWWGEGECKCYIDGDLQYPSLCGTGTEDYIGTAWGQGQYDHQYQGCHLADGERLQYNFYRWHIPDPIYFHKDIRVTMHQIGYCSLDVMQTLDDAGVQLTGTDPATGIVNFKKCLEENKGTLYEREHDDWSSCAYIYLDTPANDFSRLDPAEQRYAGLAAITESKRMDQ